MRTVSGLPLTLKDATHNTFHEPLTFYVEIDGYAGGATIPPSGNGIVRVSFAGQEWMVPAAGFEPATS
jgi:hypothetical protein